MPPSKWKGLEDMVDMEDLEDIEDTEDTYKQETPDNVGGFLLARKGNRTLDLLITSELLYP